MVSLASANIYKKSRGLGTVLHVSNQLFTPWKNASEMEAVMLEKGIGPRGAFREVIAGGKFIHSEDNHIDYYACVTEEGQ